MALDFCQIRPKRVTRIVKFKKRGGGGDTLPWRWKRYFKRTKHHNETEITYLFETSKLTTKVIQVCVPVLMMWTWMLWWILRLTYNLRPVLYSSGQRDATVKNRTYGHLTLQFPLHAAVFHQWRQVRPGHFHWQTQPLFNPGVKWLTVFGPFCSVQKTHTEHLSLNLFSRSGKRKNPFSVQETFV
jgi:hypothetical protein